jgi:hypothetical protein
MADFLGSFVVPFDPLDESAWQRLCGAVTRNLLSESDR